MQNILQNEGGGQNERYSMYLLNDTFISTFFTATGLLNYIKFVKRTALIRVGCRDNRTYRAYPGLRGYPTVVVGWKWLIATGLCDYIKFVNRTTLILVF